MKKLSLILACTLVMMAGCKPKDNPIKLNQVGFYPQAEKTASIEDDARTNEAALLTMDGKVVWEGKAVREAVSPWSGKTRHIIDFSEVTEPGEYLLRVQICVTFVTMLRFVEMKKKIPPLSRWNLLISTQQRPRDLESYFQTLHELSHVIS